MPFRSVVAAGGFKWENISGLLDEIWGRRLLLLVPAISGCEPLFAGFAKHGCEVIVSCSLGEGQHALAEFLRACRGWSKVLLFENSAAGSWKCSDFKGRYHQVLVDRICWDMLHYEISRPQVFCHCESSKNIRFHWPDAAQIPCVHPGTELASPIVGERVIFTDADEQVFEDRESSWFHLRKRALVNAPHAITALLCYRLLATRKMVAKNQFLAPIQEMIGGEHAEWNRAMDHYLRLRAIQVAWRKPGYKPEKEPEKLHAEYLEAYTIARETRRRFFQTNDQLDRLMKPENLRKELSKFSEHILRPLEFYEKHRAKLIRTWRWGRPPEADIRELRDFLTETFLEAGDWLMASGPARA